MSPVQSCTGCGGLFSFLPRGLCADCIDRREEHFVSVREWLRDNPGGSVLGACESTGVPERVISEFIREGRLDFTSDVTPSLEELRAKEEIRARIATQMAAREKAEAEAAAARANVPAGMRTRRP